MIVLDPLASREMIVDECSTDVGNLVGVDRPIAESIEYLPPTQSQNGNMSAVSMPNLVTSAVAVAIKEPG